MPELKSIDTSHWRDADIEVRYVVFGAKITSYANRFSVGQLPLR